MAACGGGIFNLLTYKFLDEFLNGANTCVKCNNATDAYNTDCLTCDATYCTVFFILLLRNIII